jgi:basic membrane lipoprotein Med (substrate-binding protein (PBP1-ABC) superfamily)
VVGYHYDAQALDPAGGLTGSAWDWHGLYENIITSVADKKFTGGPYNANWVGTFAMTTTR